MMSVPIPCCLCDKSVSYNHIAGHLMTHKEELVPFLQTDDLCATVQSNDSEKYYCCFGCKKMMKDKKKMRTHMKSSAECQEKHRQFLKDIGVNVNASLETVQRNSDNETIRRLQIEVDGLREVLAEYKEGYKIKILEEELGKATTQIRRLEEFYSLIPSLMKPELLKYCDSFVTIWKQNQSSMLDGYLKKQRKEELFHLLQTTPLLQMYFVPTYNFLVNHHVPNGEHQGMLCGYFNNLDFACPTQPISRDIGELPVLPQWNIKAEERKALENFVESAPVQEKKVDPEPPRPMYPTIILNSKTKRPAKKTDV